MCHDFNTFFFICFHLLTTKTLYTVLKKTTNIEMNNYINLKLKLILKNQRKNNWHTLKNPALKHTTLSFKKVTTNSVF